MFSTQYQPTTDQLTAHSFVVITLFIGLIFFTPGTQVNMYVSLIPVISEYWTDLSAAGWLLLLILGMGSQLIWVYRERHLVGTPCWKMCIIVYALDLYHMYVYELYYSKKLTSSCIIWYSNPSYYGDWLGKCTRLLIKKSGSESCGQEEAACGHIFSPMWQSQWVTYTDGSSKFLKCCSPTTITAFA